VVVECTDPYSNLIEEGLCSFQQLQERRRLLYCPRTLRDMLSGTLPVFQRNFEYFNKQNFDAEAMITLEFIRNIHPFSNVDLDTQILLVRNFVQPMVIIERYYATYRNNGHLNNRIYTSNYCYVDIAEEEAKMKSKPNPTKLPTAPTDKLSKEVKTEKPENDGQTQKAAPKVTPEKSKKDGAAMISPQTVVDLNIPYLKKAIVDIVHPMAAIEITDVEIVGMMLIMLFDPNISELSSATKSVIKSIRDRVYEDWMAIYQLNRIMNGPEKVGNVVLLMSSIQEYAKLINQNFHFFRVFGLDYNKLLDDVFT